MTKPGLTLEQHHTIGAELANIYDRLIALSVEVTNAYPKASPHARKLDVATRRLSSARSALDDAMFIQHGIHGCTRAYYPSSDPDARPGCPPHHAP